MKPKTGIFPSGTIVSILTRLWENRTFNQGLQINAVRAVSLGIGFFGSIWASRCLGPDKLGISGMIIGTIAPLVLLVSLGQGSHFVRLYRGYESDAERADLVSLLSTYKITVSGVLMLVAIPLLLLGHFSSSWYLGLFAAFPFFFLTANAADWLLQSEEKVPAITMAMAVQAVITTSLYFLIFRPGMSAGADLVIQSIGLTAATSYAWYTALNGRKIRLFVLEKLPLIWPLIYEGRWMTAIAVEIYIFTNLEVPLVGYLYSLKEVGIYRTSIVLVGGVGAFTGYIPMLLYPRMIEWSKKGPHHLWSEQKKVIVYFSMFAGCLSLVAFLSAPYIYHYVYGPAFQRGAYPFAILLSAKLMAVLSGVLCWGMAAQKKDKPLFIIMGVVCIFSVTANLIFIPLFGAFGASSINLSSELLMFALIFAYTMRSLKKNE